MKKILWWRIALAAFALEMLYGMFLVFLLGAAEEAYTARGIACVFAFMMIGGLWIGWKAAWRPVLQGSLVGVVAVLIYIAITLPGVVSGELAISAPLLLNHVAKVLGASCGGWVSSTMLARTAES